MPAQLNAHQQLVDNPAALKVDISTHDPLAPLR